MEQLINILEETSQKLENYYAVTDIAISYVMEMMVLMISLLAVPASQQQKRKITYIKTSYGRKKKLREETKCFRQCVSLPIRSNPLLGEFIPVYFYNLESMLKIWLGTKGNDQRLEAFHNTPINPGVYDSPKNCAIYQELQIATPDPVILLAVFCDEVTPFGSLYAKSSAYKLFNFYVIIILPGPKQRKLDQVFPLCLILSAQISELGLEQVTQKIAENLATVVSNGFFFNGRKYQARVIYIIGDNLGQNQLLGLTLSWQTGKSCRFCHYRMAELRSVNSAEDFQTGADRTALEYEETISAALNGETLRHGFTSMPSFHTIPFLPRNSTTYTLDVDHDFYIGCALHWMVAIINNLIYELNWLSPTTMVACWKRMKFSEQDARNRPFMKFDTAKKTVKLCSKVSHIKNLIHSFSIVLFPFVEDTEAAPWKFFLLILHLSRLLRTTRHTETTLDQLQLYIKATLNARISFTRKPDGQFQPTVRYKEHNLTHYPQIIRRFGPLTLQSSSLGEQFHQLTKKCFGNSKCSQHLLKTIHRRMDSQIYSRTKGSDPEIQSTPLKNIDKLDDITSREFYSMNDPSCWIKHFVVQGRKFKVGGVFGVPRRDDEAEPRFFWIVAIIKQGSKWIIAEKPVKLFALPSLGLFEIQISESTPRRRDWNNSLIPILYYSVHDGQTTKKVFSLKDFNLHRR